MILGSRILYYVFIIPFSIMPMWYLHFMSTCSYFLLYHVFGYRKAVIRRNLKNALPHLNEAERKKVERKFYAHLCDLIVESIKFFTISEKSVRKRMVIENPEVIDRFYDEGKNVIMVGGHYNSWEMYALAMPIYHKHRGIGIYKPLSNKFFDEKIRKTRERFGIKMIPMKATARYFEDHDSKEKYGFIFASDQSPGNPRKAYWMEFLSQDTGVQFGVEKYAKKYNLPVVYGDIIKTRRSHYRVTYRVICEDPSKAGYGEITETHTRALESIILKQPEYWLWSHKRWKHKRPETLDVTAP